jgi:hypothetical protein
MSIEISPDFTRVRCKTYHEALTYVIFLDIDGKRDWRLPTPVERKVYDLPYCWDTHDSTFNDQGYAWDVRAVRNL